MGDNMQKILLIILVFVISFSGCSFFENKNLKEENVLFNEITEKEIEALKWQTNGISQGNILEINTEKGKMSFKLFDCVYSDLIEEKISQWNSSEITVAAKDMFIQMDPRSDEKIDYEKTDLGCFYGSIGFVVDNGKVSDSVVIISRKKINGQSSLYMDANFSDNQKKNLYDVMGGIPEYEENVVIFGQLVDGIEILDSIEKEKTNGYVNGYILNEPVPVHSFTFFESNGESYETED